jgi:diphthamide synthase subunit DPH2
MGAGEASEFTPTSATQNIAALDVLLTVQSADDPTERAARKRMTARADAILTTLDDLRMGILTGTLTIGHMIDVADVVAAHREKIHDPHLTAILDEIDLRAQVEIAKLSMIQK